MIEDATKCFQPLVKFQGGSIRSDFSIQRLSVFLLRSCWDILLFAIEGHSQRKKSPANKYYKNFSLFLFYMLLLTVIRWHNLPFSTMWPFQAITLIYIVLSSLLYFALCVECSWFSYNNSWLQSPILLTFCDYLYSIEYLFMTQNSAKIHNTYAKKCIA